MKIHTKDNDIMGWVGGVDKEISEEVWKEMNIRQALSEGRNLYNWVYNPDPDPDVFKHGEARISYFTKPFADRR